MRYFSALWARIYRLSANSRATISSTAIFLSQQSRQYFSSPRGSETSLAPHSAHRDLTTALRDIGRSILARGAGACKAGRQQAEGRLAGINAGRLEVSRRAPSILPAV